MYRTVFWTLWERERVGWFGRMALKHVYYHMWNKSPVQVWCMIQDARGWYTGMTQRDGMGREVGGVFRIGNTCTLVADLCWCMAKLIQYCKVKKKLKKIWEIEIDIGTLLYMKQITNKNLLQSIRKYSKLCNGPYEKWIKKKKCMYVYIITDLLCWTPKTNTILKWIIL